MTTPGPQEIASLCLDVYQGSRDWRGAATEIERWLRDARAETWREAAEVLDDLRAEAMLLNDDDAALTHETGRDVLRRRADAVEKGGEG